MPTGSYIELFLTTFGWNLYDIVWGVITSTGLAFLPIFAAVIDNVVKPMESQEQKSAAVTSLRRLEIDIIRIIIMLTLAVQPFFTLSFSSITYTSVGDVNPKTVTQGHTGTSYDNVFTPQMIDGVSTKVPMWFYIVMSVSGGINNAVISRLPHEISSRQVQMDVDTMHISDPHLRMDTERFVTECYKPATADFFNNQRQLGSQYTTDDISWIGSKYFLNNIYKTLNAQSPVPGFPFNPSRAGDMAHSGNGQITPTNGYPSCYEWWTSPNNGLKDRLLKEAPPSTLDELKSLITDGSADDQAIRKLLQNESSDIMSGLKVAPSANSGQTDWTNLSQAHSQILDYLGGAMGIAGGAIVDFLSKPILYMVVKAAPYVQATMLMAIYFLLPWILLVGNFEWSTIKTATVTIFAIKFWTSIWAVVGLLDNKLYTAIKTGTGIKGFDIVSTAPTVQSIVDLLILSLYTVLPLFFLSMLAWGGERSASVADNATGGISNRTSSGGQAGSDVVKSVVN